ncbi:MAG: type I DNA topoisomerase [Chloroflexi bacterium]|nr:type I DNA topoisomerase [Chloroflexota bacterium]
MAKDLVIVESPAKARTVGRFLGDKYEALASMGHVRDLPKGKMGVEIDEKGFHATYTVLPDKKKIVSELRKASKAAGTVYLATDPDREGEAISWHLINAIKIDPKKVKRVVFHEITKEAIKEAFDNPRELDQNLVDAQQARRILDRLVGYRLSPVLWGKVRRGLSAGRVQSVALRLVVDREREIGAFQPVEYWTIDANLAKHGDSAKKRIEFKAGLHSLKGDKKKMDIPNGDRSAELTSDLEGAVYAVSSVRKRETKSKPSAPFITSTMQQEAWRKLRYTARRTMQVAQQLYEGMEIGDEGLVGLITYMRTDSTTVAEAAIKETIGYIKSKYGAEYAPGSVRVYTKKVKGAQEAHEAIRPTSVLRAPETVRSYLKNDQFKLYSLVWQRMVASQMSDALFDSTTVEIEASSTKSDTQYQFRARGSVLKFPGFRTVYMESADEPASQDEETPSLPELAKEDVLDCLDLSKEQHFTQPPPRFTEATLIRTMEDKGIGRPSTYAPIMATILDRDYVLKDQGRFTPTKLGMAVTDLLKQHFPDIMDVGFTAKIEDQLDNVAEGQQEWEPMLKDFYEPFDKSIEKAMKEAERVPRDQIDEETDEFCEKCERPMVIKSGRFGRFMSCSGFPDCKNSKPIIIRVGVPCPECGKDMVERRQKGRGGKVFYGCSGYPDCKFALNQRPLPQPCPECDEMLVVSGRENARCLTCKWKGARPETEEEAEESMEEVA